MQVLGGVVQELLSDSTTISTNLKWQAPNEIGFRGAIGGESWSSCINGEFCTPEVNFSELLHMAKAQQSEAGDRLWLLQTDPAYLLAEIKVNMKFQIGGMIDSETKLPMKYALIPLVMWTAPVLETMDWAHAIEEIENVMRLEKEFDGQLALGKALPLDLDRAISCLHYQLLKHMSRRRCMVRHLLTRYPNFEAYYKVIEENGLLHVRGLKNVDHDGDREQYIKQLRDLHTKDLLYCTLNQLRSPTACTSEELKDDAAKFKTLDEILCKQQSTQEDRMGETLLYRVSCVAATHKILTTVQNYRPRSSQIPVDDLLANRPDRSGYRYDYGDKRKRALHLLPGLVKHFNVLEQARLPQGKRDQHWLGQMTAIRDASSEFFNQCRKIRA